jgi:hypothetical protein
LVDDDAHSSETVTKHQVRIRPAYTREYSSVLSEFEGQNEINTINNIRMDNMIGENANTLKIMGGSFLMLLTKSHG